jgi:antitoxin component HigA of HigAB toxin-antitoxin module
LLIAPANPFQICSRSRELLQRDYRAALGVLDSLTVREEGSLDAGEQDYLDTLTMLVEAYDREGFELESQAHDPLTMLKYVMQESGMTQGLTLAGFLAIARWRRLFSTAIET